MTDRTATAVAQVNNRDHLVAEKRRVRNHFSHGHLQIINRLYHSTKASLRHHVQMQGLGYNSRFILNTIAGADYDAVNEKHITDVGLAACFLSGTLWNGDIPTRSPYGAARQCLLFQQAFWLSILSSLRILGSSEEVGILTLIFSLSRPDLTKRCGCAIT